MESQSPKTTALGTLPAVEPAAVPNDAVATTEPAAVANMEQEPSVIREQDRLMPVANVSRIMRQVLPPYAKISDDTKEVIQECVSEFISFVTSEANERCHAERRNTVTTEDIVWAMNHLGFDDYVAPLGTFLRRMRESEGGARRGAAAGRGSRRGSPVPAVLPVHHGAQMCPAGRRLPLPAASQASAGRPVPCPPVPAATAPHFGDRYQMLGHQRPMLVPYYGGAAAFQAGGGHREFYADEASSSNEDPPAGRAEPH